MTDMCILLAATPRCPHGRPHGRSRGDRSCSMARRSRLRPAPARRPFALAGRRFGDGVRWLGLGERHRPVAVAIPIARPMISRRSDRRCREPPAASIDGHLARRVTHLPALLGPRGEGRDPHPRSPARPVAAAGLVAGPGSGRVPYGPPAPSQDSRSIGGGIVRGPRFVDLGPAITPLPRTRAGGDLVETGAHGLVRHPSTVASSSRRSAGDPPRLRSIPPSPSWPCSRRSSPEGGARGGPLEQRYRATRRSAPDPRLIP